MAADKVEPFHKSLPQVEEVSLGIKKTNDDLTQTPTQKWFYTVDKKRQRNASAKTKRKHIEHLFKDNIRNEFGVGLIKIVTNPHIVIKLFWIVCLIGSFTISSYLIIGNILKYFKYEVTTKVRHLYESPSLFPEVIVCNQNKITSQTGFNLSLNSDFLDNLGQLPASTQIRLGHSTMICC